MSLSHSDRLLLYCRLCGQRTVNAAKDCLLHPVEAFGEVIRKIHPEFETQQREEIYPKYICYECRNKLCKKDPATGDDMKQKVIEIIRVKA